MFAGKISVPSGFTDEEDILKKQLHQGAWVSTKQKSALWTKN